MMKTVISVDILRREITGIPRYTYELLAALAALLDGDDRLLLLNNSFRRGVVNQPRLPCLDNPRVQIKNLIVSRKLLQKVQAATGLPRLEHLIGRFDVFHATAHDELPLTRAPLIMTIHDLSYLHPGYHTPEFTSYLDHYFRDAATRADHIVADSHATRRDVIERLGVPENKVTTVHIAGHGRARVITGPDALRGVCARHGLDCAFLLYVGTLEPRKNVANLIRAYDAFRAGRANAPLLALAGGKGWMYEQIFAAAEASPFRDDIRFLGYVDDADLAPLMNAALGFVYPSLFEGFGLPVLEAMQCGAPVITSNVSSLPEVAGDAALLVDPHSVDALAHAMGRLADDETLRRDLSRKGLEQAATFSWERCANETLAVYRMAAGQ